MATCETPFSRRRLVEAPQTFMEWWFTVRWEWLHRNWKPTRQKMKAFDRDLDLYRKNGRTPW